jgi:hypothetical protein
VVGATPDGGEIVVRFVGGLIIWLGPDWTLRRLAYRAEKQILRRPPSRTSLLRRVASRSTTKLFARPSRQPWEPILLVRGDVTANRAVQIADGYHRVCASYHNDENTDIPCRIVDLPPGH